MPTERGIQGSTKPPFEFSNGWLEGHCPHCNVLFSIQVDEEAIRGASDEGEDITLLYENCPKCKHLIVLLDFYRKDLGKDVIYPKTPIGKELPSEIPDLYRNLYREAVLVQRDSPRSSAMLCRALLQLVLRDHYQIRAKPDNLHNEIATFISGSNIPSYIYQDLDRLKEMGNLAAHPLLTESSKQLIEVEPMEAMWLLEVIHAFLDFAFVQPKRQEERRSRLDEKIKVSNEERKRRQKQHK